jgi:hypothetical protein
MTTRPTTSRRQASISTTFLSIVLLLCKNFCLLPLTTLNQALFLVKQKRRFLSIQARL